VPQKIVVTKIGLLMPQKIVVTIMPEKGILKPIRVLINYKVEIPELQGQLHIMFLRIPTVGLVPEDLAPKCHVEPQERLRVTQCEDVDT